MLRVGRRDASVPDWLVGCGAASTPDWLASRAATLQYLATVQYPAPRMIATRTGDTIGHCDGWCTFATTFINGRVVDPAPRTLYGMGKRLGQLHCLPAARHAPTAPQPGQSWWYPDHAIPAILAQYAALLPALPDSWVATVDAFCDTLRAIHAQQLPLVIIHGDGWAANAVESPDGEMILIDWEPSGLGNAILDLGRLLLHAHQTLAAPNAVPEALSTDFIHAVVDGYCEARIPPPSERAILLEAIRFSVALGAASHVARAVRSGWSDQSPARLRRRQQWFTLSESIAAIAHRRLEQHGGS